MSTTDKMFNIDTGRQAIDDLLARILEGENVSLWYKDSYYDTDMCWQRAASERVAMIDDAVVVTGLMAWLIAESDESLVGKGFSDGFTYALGEALRDKYEMMED